MNSVGSNGASRPTSLTIYCKIRYPSNVDDDYHRNSFRDGCLSKIKKNQKCSMSIKCHRKIKRCTAWFKRIDEHCSEYECTSSSNFLKTD